MMLLLAFQSGITAQNLEDLDFGTDSTFEVITWNIEWFPKDGPTTVNYVEQIIQELDADVLAVQEIDDTSMFTSMLNEIAGFKGHIHDGYFAGLAYIYKPAYVEITDIYQIYTSEPYWRPFLRSPLVMELNHAGNEYVIINNHFKCCGDGYMDPDDPWDEETRRYDASNLLKEYIDNHFPEKKVFVVGDLNDNLTDDSENNVFQMFFNDPENYEFADMDIAEGDSEDWSYPTWPSHLDHLLLTEELFDELNDASCVVESVKIDEYLDNGWWEYENYVSDHRPVGIRFEPEINSGLNENTASAEILQVYPNPIKDKVSIHLEKEIKNAAIECYDLQGHLIRRIPLEGSQRIVQWDCKSLPAGFYLLKLTDGVQHFANIKVIKAH